MRITNIILILCCTPLAGAVTRPTAAGDTRPGLPVSRDRAHDVKDLGWLKGCWRANVKGRTISEHWMAPGGGTMLGMSRTVADDKTVEFEFMQIRQEAGGEIYFDARPSGQQPASFRLVGGGPREAVFENPEHDFPQRIIYRLEGAGALSAAIEGSVRGRRRSINFAYEREACD